MELEFQWDLVEDEVSTVMDALQETVENELGYLKDQVESQSSHPCDLAGLLTEFVQIRLRPMYLVISLKASMPEFKG